MYSRHDARDGTNLSQGSIGRDWRFLDGRYRPLVALGECGVTSWGWSAADDQADLDTDCVELSVCQMAWL